MEDTLFGLDRVDLLVERLQASSWTEKGKVVRWPADDRRDREFVALLMKDYPDKDLMVEIPKWVVWMIEHDSDKKVRPYARLHTWLSGRGGPRSVQRSGRAPGTGSRGQAAGGTPTRGLSGSGVRDW